MTLTVLNVLKIRDTTLLALRFNNCLRTYLYEFELSLERPLRILCQVGSVKKNRRKIVHILRYSRVQCGRFGVHNPGGIQIFFFSEMFTSFLESTRPIVHMDTGYPSQGNKAAEA